MRGLAGILGVVAAAAAAADNTTCDVLVPSVCYLPFPNNFWLRPDPTNSSRAVTTFSNGTWPRTNDGEQFDVSKGWNGLDGFSPFPAILSYFPNVSLELSTGLPPIWDIGASLRAGAATWIVNSATGELVAHWVELDHASDGWEPDASNLRMFMMWPSERLNDSTRYVIGIGPLVDMSGHAIPASTAFAALRDGTPYAPIESRRQHYESDIFPLLMAVGAKRASLSLAWDFTTGSRDEWTGDMVSMRDDAFERLPSSGPAYTITSVTNGGSDPAVAKIIKGTVAVPWYLNTCVGTLVVESSRCRCEPTGGPCASQSRVSAGCAHRPRR